MNPALLLNGLIGAAPGLAFWIAVFIFAAVMLGRSGGRPERFFMTGAGLNIISKLLTIPTNNVMFWLLREDYSVADAASVTSGYGIICNIVGMAGIICLIYAFWIKFKAKNSESEVSDTIPALERGNHGTVPEY